MSLNRLIPLAVIMLIILSIFCVSWILIDYDSDPEIEVYQASEGAIVFPSVETYQEIVEEYPYYGPRKRQSLLPDLIKAGKVSALRT
jgi:hypothetical protein